MMSLIFAAAKGPAYLVALLTLVFIFSLDRIMTLVRWIIDEIETRKRKKNKTE